MSKTISLKKLSLQNFGPFVGSHELELPANGLVMINGENLDTGESSGSGKSSFVQAIAFAFDFSSFASTELRSWPFLTEEPMKVEINFNASDCEIQYSRGSSACLKRVGKDIVTGAKAAKEELNKIVGVRPEILQALTYRPQGKPGMFLNLVDAEKKSFLTELLGLQIYEIEADRIVKIISELEQLEISKKAVLESAKSRIPVKPEQSSLPVLDIQELESKISVAKSNIEQNEQTLQQLKSDVDAAIQAQVDRENSVNAQFEPLIKTAKNELKALKANPPVAPELVVPEEPAELPILKKKLSMLQAAIAKAKNKHQLRVKALRLYLQESRDFYSQMNSRSQGEKRIALTEKARIEEELAQLVKMICPTCVRPWSDEKHEEKIKEMTEGIASCNEALAVAENNELEAAKVEARIKDTALQLSTEEEVDPVPAKIKEGEKEFVQRVAACEAEYKSLLANAAGKHKDEVKLAMAGHNQRVAELESKLAQTEKNYVEALCRAQEMTEAHAALLEDLSLVKERLASLSSDKRMANIQMDAAKKSYQDLLSQFNKDMESWKLATEYAETVERDLAAISKSIDTERDYLGCIRSFLGAVFDQTLDRVAFLSNERISKVPNVQDLTLSFVSERETKTTKNLRQEIKPIIERNGQEIPLKRLSGGQQASVNLAVDLSLSQVISERTGVSPSWLVLDEALDGLSLRSKQSCIEMLREAANYRLILVIDHTSELKEMFSQVITVRNIGGKSSFVL